MPHRHFCQIKIVLLARMSRNKMHEKSRTTVLLFYCRRRDLNPHNGSETLDFTGFLVKSYQIVIKIVITIFCPLSACTPLSDQTKTHHMYNFPRLLFPNVPEVTRRRLQIHHCI